MTELEVEQLLEGLLHSIREGVREAKDAYRELSGAFNVWKKRKTRENWAEVEYRAQGVRMWLLPEDKKPKEKPQQKKDGSN